MGFEPTTTTLATSCSSQLSYTREIVLPVLVSCVDSKTDTPKSKTSTDFHAHRARAKSVTTTNRAAQRKRTAATYDQNP